MIWYYMWKNMYQSWYKWATGQYSKAEPRTIYITDGMSVHIQTDDQAESFDLRTNKRAAARAYIDRALKEVQGVALGDFNHKIGVAEFIFQDNKLVNVAPVFSDEDRQDVLDVIKAMQAFLKLKSFW